MIELNQYTQYKESSPRSFGFVFSIFFIILALLPTLYDQKIDQLYLFLAFCIFLISFIYPSFFYFPNLVWLKIGEILGKIVSPLIMLLIFVLAFLTTKLVLFIFNKQLLNDRFDKNIKTYWKKYEDNKGGMKDQF